jgi:hypothetical protein
LWQTCSCGFMRLLLLRPSTSKTAAEPVSFQPLLTPRFDGVLPAYLFVRNGTQWSQQQMLTATDKATQRGFGRAVGMSDDGNTALIGGYGKDNKTGVVYLAVRDGAQWSTQTLKASDVADNEDFGHRVAVSGDGNTAVVTALGAKGNLGSAYLYTRAGAGWSNPRKLTPAAAPYDNFGDAVAISGDGATVIVGAKDPLDDPGYGGAFVFV